MLGHDDYRREFEAEFIAGGASFIENSAIRECVADWKEALPADGCDWVLAFDAAFSSDPSAVAVVGRSRTDRTHLICGHTQRWLPPRTRSKIRRSRDEDTARIESVIAAVASIATTFQAPVVVDQHQPGVVVHEFLKHGVHARVRPARRERLLTRRQAVFVKGNWGGYGPRLVFDAGSPPEKFPNRGYCRWWRWRAATLTAAIDAHPETIPPPE